MCLRCWSLPKSLDCEKTIVLGYRDELFLNKEFEQYGKVVIATEDGSCGTKGNVLDAIRAESVDGQVIYSCGPDTDATCTETVCS